MPLPNSTKYYQESDRYPKIVKLLITRLLLYVAESIYTEEYTENPEAAMWRLRLSDVQAGDDVMLKDSVRVTSRDGNEPKTVQTVNEAAIDIFSRFTKYIPFTGYNIDESRLGDIKNYTAYSGDTFGLEIGRKGAAWQEQIDVQFVSFFNKADDYYRALAQLQLNSTTYNRIRVPIKLNRIQQTFHKDLVLEYDTTFPMDVAFDVSKGSLSNQFQQYLTKNRIWNLSFTAKIKFYNYQFSEYLGDITVQEMIVNLQRELEDGSTSTLGPFYVPDPPIVVSTVPANLATNVPILTTNVITITFNHSMNENSVVDKVTFSPNVDVETLWDMPSTILNYTLNTPLSPNTTYTITVPMTVTDYYGNNPEADYVFSFTTGA